MWRAVQGGSRVWLISQPSTDDKMWVLQGSEVTGGEKMNRLILGCYGDGKERCEGEHVTQPDLTL